MVLKECDLNECGGTVNRISKAIEYEYEEKEEEKAKSEKKLSSFKMRKHICFSDAFFD